MTENKDALEPCPSVNNAFWAKVDRSCEDGCWPWTGAKNRKGYGNFRSRSAHVVAFEFAIGKVPEGLEIDHKCRTRDCVNPSHLEAVTHQENVRRAQPTHCVRGHPLSGENVRIFVRPDGTRRRCKTCHSSYRHRKAASNG